jgi:hypothetical protein
MFRIEFKPQALTDLKRIKRYHATAIVDAIEHDLAEEPERITRLDQTAAWTTANNLPAADRGVSGFLRCARSAGGDRPDLSQGGDEDLL